MRQQPPRNQPRTSPTDSFVALLLSHPPAEAFGRRVLGPVPARTTWKIRDSGIDAILMVRASAGLRSLLPKSCQLSRERRPKRAQASEGVGWGGNGLRLRCGLQWSREFLVTLTSTRQKPTEQNPNQTLQKQNTNVRKNPTRYPKSGSVSTYLSIVSGARQSVTNSKNCTTIRPVAPQTV
ncbi:hypothetical protein SAMN05421858_0729 [Haladaptatus litoreus]|uniref:Uncharacterized protein n=1 Tax=Haladaptatus litoreus TaxID=553468 RepID=A0A1N6WI02_9EURY|nr:hypothetical protein SAMN05421858_0729 [Haladaptatus litoreus]